MTDLLVTGAGGHLGGVLLRRAVAEQRDVLGVVRPSGVRPPVGACIELALEDAPGMVAALREHRPRAVVHLAAVTSIAQAAADKAFTFALNVEASARLAEACAELGARFVFASTDLVFDGEAAPYDEQATPRPTTTYGLSKHLAEARVLAHGGVVTRLPWMYGLPATPRPPAFFAAMLAALSRGEPLTLFEDEYRTPLWYEDAARALMRVAASTCEGVLHLGGPERLSRLQIGTISAEALGIAHPRIQAARQTDVASPEPRSRDCSLISDRYAALFGEPPGRPLREALRSIAEQQPLRGV